MTAQWHMSQLLVKYTFMHASGKEEGSRWMRVGRQHTGKWEITSRCSNSESGTVSSNFVIYMHLVLKFVGGIRAA